MLSPIRERIRNFLKNCEFFFCWLDNTSDPKYVHLDEWSNGRLKTFPRFYDKDVLKAAVKMGYLAERTTLATGTQYYLTDRGRALIR